MVKIPPRGPSTPGKSLTNTEGLVLSADSGGAVIEFRLASGLDTFLTIVSMYISKYYVHIGAIPQKRAFFHQKLPVGSRF